MMYDASLTCRPAKRKREEDAERQEKINKGISKYFNQSNAAPAPKAKPVRTAEDDEFMAGLLGEVDTNVQSRAPSYGKAVRSNDRRKTRVLSPPLESREPTRQRPARREPGRSAPARRGPSRTRPGGPTPAAIPRSPAHCRTAGRETPEWA